MVGKTTKILGRDRAQSLNAVSLCSTPVIPSNNKKNLEWSQKPQTKTMSDAMRVR